jgi:hypothetical protein
LDDKSRPVIFNTKRQEANIMKLRTFVALAATGTAMLVSGCATEAPAPRQVGSDATVINRTGRTVSQIAYQPCGSQAGAWNTVQMPSIAPGGSIVFTLPAPCSNLRAYYAEGQIAGMHTGVKWDFPFTWVVQ